MTATVFTTMNTYPAFFNKKSLALALEQKTGTSFFFPSSKVNSRALCRYLFAYPAFLEFIIEKEKSYKELHYFTGPDAEKVCQILGLSSTHFQ